MLVKSRRPEYSKVIRFWGAGSEVYCVILHRLGNTSALPLAHCGERRLIGGTFMMVLILDICVGKQHVIKLLLAAERNTAEETLLLVGHNARC